MKHAIVGSLGVLAALAGPAHADGYCAGDYAEDLSALSPHARDLESHSASYSYAVRTTATYECVSYGADGNLRKTLVPATAYGTAFGLRHEAADTLLVTNEHVAEWPAVTDADHPIDGVPAGCKRISDALFVVDDDHDDYAADDIPLSRVVADPQLDIAVLRAHSKLEVIPWKIGKSKALAARTTVEVRGFPLGEFRATNVGKVISAYSHDDQGEWNHDDFAVDALLSSGGSGSPVLAVSCKTGEFELVGVFHARYARASALNMVIAIDQVRDLLATLKRSPRPAPIELDSSARDRLAAALRSEPDSAFFPLGAMPAQVIVRDDGALVFAIYAADFPRTSAPVLVLEDAPDGKAFGKLAAAFVARKGGLEACDIAAADADAQAQLAHALEALRAAALATFDARTAARASSGSRAAFEQSARQQRALHRLIDAQRDASAGFADLATRLHSAGAPVRLAEITTPPAPPSPIGGGGTEASPR